MALPMIVAITKPSNIVISKKNTMNNALAFYLHKSVTCQNLNTVTKVTNIIFGLFATIFEIDL